VESSRRLRSDAPPAFKPAILQDLITLHPALI
jgi:hypothetical protein